MREWVHPRIRLFWQWMLSAALLSATVAALPNLLGEPPGEWANLRGLAAGILAGLISLPLAAFLGATFSSQRVAKEEPETALSEACPASRSPARTAATVGSALLCLTDFAFLAAVGLLAILGAHLAGGSWEELEDLSALAQRAWGWVTPIPFAYLIAGASLAVYGVAHLGVVLRGESRLHLALVATGAAGGAALTAAAHQELLRVGAVLGAERMTKASALAALAVLATASAVGIAGSSARRSHTLAWGLLATGLGAGVFERWYLNPRIEGLRAASLGGRPDGWATVAGYPVGREDLVATFGIPPDADRIELGGLTPRIGGEYRCSPFAVWSPGVLYWLEPESAEVKQVLRDGMGG